MNVTQFIQQLINGLSQGSIYALIAVGYTMVYGVLQLINFAHGDVFMVGSMVSLYAATGRVAPALPWWLHVLIVVAFVATFAIRLAMGISLAETFKRLLPLVCIYLISIPAFLLASVISQHLTLGSWFSALFVMAFTIAL